MPHVQSALLAGILATAAMTSPAMAGPDYHLLTTIGIPATAVNNQGGKLTAFDISFVDPVTGDYYFADRSNASVDVINGSTNTVINQVGGFAGQQATTSISGPDGVVVADNGTTATLFAGDAGSTLRVFNVTNPTAATPLYTLNTGGGAFRVDEMAYSPSANQLMVANNANTPAFATLINTSTTPGTVVKGNITIPTSPPNGGLEQSVWDQKTGTYFVSVPALNGAGNPGGVAEIDTSGNVINTFDFGTMGIGSCSPAGLALGGSGNLMVGCANAMTQTVVLNPVTGKIVTTIAAVSGSDELWYDPVTKNFYVTGVDASGNRVIDVVSDATDSILQEINLSALGAGVNAHSVAVDPLNGDIFVPLEGTTAAAADTLCPNGCVAVFAAPEPGSLPIIVVGLAGLIGLTVRRRLHSSRV